MRFDEGLIFFTLFVTVIIFGFVTGMWGACLFIFIGGIIGGLLGLLL